MPAVATKYAVHSSLVKAAYAVVSPFLSRDQARTMGMLCNHEEGDCYRQKFRDLEKLISEMPATYQQRELGDEAIVHLHYFAASSDWWIIEKDIDGGVEQAYGFVCLNGDTMCAETGYISITELVENHVELDLHWTPVTLGTIKAKVRSR